MRRSILGGLLLAGAGLACSADTVPATGLVLGLQLDLVVPEDTDHVAVLVTSVHDGKSTRQPPAELKPIDGSKVSFVATLVLESHDPSDIVQVRFVAFDAAGNVRAMREARTKVPDRDTALLRMPLLWINDGLVKDTGSGPLAASRAGGLELQNASLALQSLTDDVFDRLSSDCPLADHTRGNDGLCHSIDDVVLETLPDAGVVPDLLACFDLDTCFSGQQVRSFDLATLQGCTLPIDSTAGVEEPALVLTGPNTGGYRQTKVENARTNLRPIDDVLYTYKAASHSIELGEALCAKVQRDHIPTALVSAKCAAKTTNNPVCYATSQSSTGAAPPGPGVFTGGDAGTPIDDGGLVDAGPDGSEPPPPTPIDRSIAITDSVVSFGVRGGGGGVVYVLEDRGENGNRVLRSRWNDLADPQEIEIGNEGSYGQVMIGPDERAYLVADYQTDDGGSPLMAIGDGTIPPEPVRVCAAGACAVDPECPNQVGPTFFTVAEQDGVAAGFWGVTTNVGSTSITGANAVVARGPTAGCFEPRALPDAGPSLQFPGRLQHMYAGAVVGESLIVGVDVGNAASGPTRLLGTAETSSQAFNAQGQYVAAFGSGRGLVSVPGGTSTTFRTLGAGGQDDGASVVVPSLASVQQLFGGPGIACGLGYDPTNQGGTHLFCIQGQGNLLRPFLPKVDVEYFGEQAVQLDTYVYSDKDYLYVGQSCTSERFAIRGVPWALLQTDEQIQHAFEKICGGDQDAGHPT